jgi:hypothetical protein
MTSCPQFLTMASGTAAIDLPMSLMGGMIALVSTQAFPALMQGL